MNEEKSSNSLSEKGSELDVAQVDASVEVTPELIQDVQTPVQTTSREHHFSSLPIPIRYFVQAFKAYVLSSEDDIGLCSLSKHRTEISIDKEPMFVLVDSSGLSNPSSTELILLDDSEKDSILRKFFNTYIKPTERPSTSKELSIPTEHIKESESKEEVQMVDINLQSENEIPLDDIENENESIVLAYLRNRRLSFELDKLSESSLDVLIPSYPGSPRSINAGSEASIPSIERGTRLREAVDFLHRDNEFLVAAEIGNDRTLEKIMRAGVDLQQMDHLGRNALHLAVSSDNFRAIEMLIKAGVDTNVKDNLGMTPLSLCLMRRPSMRVANLLFDYGATIMSRTDPMDTGLFIQFVMMCEPTPEEARILRLLVEKGACVNDPEAPGGRQALHFAAMSNNCPLISILMDLGADMYLTNHRGETPLEVAQTFKCKDSAAFLFELDMENPSTTTYGTLATIATLADSVDYE